jgi:AraC-like DNA-binding protein
VRPVLQIASLAVYGYLSFRNVDHALKRFIIVVISIDIIIAVTLSISQIYYGRIFDLRLLFILLTVLIYWVSYSMLSKPDEYLETGSKTLFSLGLIKKPKYAHSSLSDEEAERIENEVKRLIFHDRIFLDSTLTIDSFAAKLNTSRHHLSQVVNERLQKTYIDLIVDARLNEARKRLCDPANVRFTIAAIALDSGFNSISSFNDVFKKRYGITPSRFRDQNLDKMIA